MTRQEYKKQIYEILVRSYKDKKIAKERMNFYKEEIEQEFNLKKLTAKEVEQGILMNFFKKNWIIFLNIQIDLK